MITVLIPAAGASSRMRGRDKLLEEIEGQALLRRQVRRALATGCPVIVCLSAERPARRAVVQDLDLQVIEVPDPEAGMSASLRAGMAGIDADATGVMVLPADMPELESAHLLKLMQWFADEPTGIWRATDEAGTPGHPVVFPRQMFPALRHLPDGEGARALVAEHEVRLCPLPGQAAVTDLDTPEDWARWRAQQD